MGVRKLLPKYLQFRQAGMKEVEINYVINDLLRIVRHLNEIRKKKRKDK